MASSTNFRLKLNLSKFYNDARKLSFVYVDTSAINNVMQLHSKIANTFGIVDSFYLITENNIFLPFVEDIRIIQPNDVITVIPGCPGLSIDAPAPSRTVTLPSKVEPSKPESPHQSEESDNTEVEVFDNSISENNVDTDIKNVNSPSTVPKKKRKRVRPRHKKNKNTLEKEEGMESKICQQNGFSNGTNGIKINNEKLTPKHLKFNSDDENLQVTNDKKGNGIPARTKPTVRSNEAASLSTLLSLKNNPVPVTYSSKRVRSNSEISHTSNVSRVSQSRGPGKNNNVKMETSPASPPVSLPENLSNGSSDIDFSKVNPLDYPVVPGAGFEIDDVVAFRTLKIGEDYSPTVSGYIIAKVCARDHNSDDYMFKIIDGHDQIKTPEGKFTLPSDNNGDENKVEVNNELINLNSVHLVEPRLIHRAK
ncbi:uncharacterized protein LOC130664475 [Microplitis mediator]|uniref:uncharacterized protein LOC130664475 n=1 Tax=Microplitis mediator TaxID=375433 RepID=UPI002553D0A9|nr:uncharacterized protein LOC130664475 [Microplitis mediator]